MGGLTHSLGRFAYLDANIIVYAVEGYREYESSIRAVLAAIDGAELIAATSELTLAEVLVRPKQDRNLALQNAYHRFLEPSSALIVAPISRDILVQASELRAATGLKLPDAIHYATAIQLGCDSFLTNDKSFRSVGPLPVHILSELGDSSGAR